MDQKPSTGLPPSEVRKRKPTPLDSHAEDGDSSSEDEHKGGVPKKTYGRTPDGKVFTVPTTHDMVSQLLDPRQPKNLSDGIVLTMLVLHMLLARKLPQSLKVPVLAAVFVFWRAAYNIGIGWLLRAQSNHGTLVVWARRMKLFEPLGENPHPQLYRFIERELKAKIGDPDYDFTTAPLEYNTWLVFRRLVDLILMCDFVSYCIFAVACAHWPVGEMVILGVGRWAIGIALVGFNLWVKLDAHRVVKDYAWYWGDFFYLIDQELTFDGVFEMAPHPMYSIGYVGYYGISLMAASYEVLFISILAHLAQFAFLVAIENPHIEKTYNPPPPRQRGASTNLLDEATMKSLLAVSGPQQQQQQQPPKPKPSTVHNLIGLSNLDLFRTTDYSVLLLALYLGVITAATPNSQRWQSVFYAHAVAWRLWTHVGLGVVLRLQSHEKMWTRHFVKYGEDTNEAWRQWKALCHTSTVMCHASGIAAAYKMYAMPDDWTSGWALLKHVGGAGLVALQMWTAASIYESLGEFGWFFGDFFFEHEAKLTYTSIYRFLNNPERLFGAAAAWGAALITWSRSMFALALLAHALQLGFLSWVEKPHMQRVFGRRLRQEAGLTKFLKRSIPPVRGWQESVDRVLDDTTRFVQEFVESARPRFATGVKTVVRDTSTLFGLAPARLTITQLGREEGADLAQHEPRHYRLEVVGESGDHIIKEAMATTDSNTPEEPLLVPFGAPLRVTWTAPADHDKADWIGLYKVTDNRSRDVTSASSMGRWAPTTAGTYDFVTADSSIAVAEQPVLLVGDVGAPPLVSGQVIFTGDKLWWTQGVYELRYHHGDSHTVMATSQPFEVRIDRFDVDDDLYSGAPDTFQRDAVEEALLPVVQNCLDRDPDIAPATVEEPFGTHVERDGKYARRVVYVVHHMFGIDFAPQVVPADGNVRRLAWRICNAKQVLAPYSMSKSRGAATPAEGEGETIVS